MLGTLDLTVRVADIAEVRDIIRATALLCSALEQSPHRVEFEPQLILLRSAITRFNWARDRQEPHEPT